MRIERSALVPFTAQRMYDLVNDVERYPERFSWCAAAEILASSKTSQHAKLTLKIAGLRTSFSTHNSLLPGKRIELKLAEGPLKALNGTWTFDDLGEDGSKVGLQIEFEFASGLLGAALRTGFERLVDRLVDDFVQCAFEQPQHDAG